MGRLINTSLLLVCVWAVAAGVQAFSLLAEAGPLVVAESASAELASCGVTQAELDADYASGGYEITVDEYCSL